MTPRKQTGRGGKKALDAIVEEQMPGWRIAGPKAKAAAKPAASKRGSMDMQSKATPSIKDLKKKFLGKGASDSDAAQGVEYGPLDKSVKTVRIERKSGGPALTADIKKGKVIIVQG